MITETEKMVCSKCGRDDVHHKTHEWNHGLCDTCYTWKRHNEDKLKVKNGSLDARMARWNELCPETYRTNDISLIDKVTFDKVFNYKISNRGIMCMGDSRTGKTTACWRMLERLYLLESISFLAFTEAEFSQETAKAQRNRSLDSWLNDLCNVRLLFIDDIGHVSATKSHLEELYFVIEKRSSWKRPIVATTNFSPNELVDRAKGSHGEKTVIAILNRLRSHCEIVNF